MGHIVRSQKNKKKKKKGRKERQGESRAPVAHACNPSYSGSRDQENHSSKLEASPGK
jgi:hypothetical protein